jgi:hypothetical protein
MEGDEFYSNFEELLFDSCRYGELEDVQYALKNNPDINYKDK